MMPWSTQQIMIMLLQLSPIVVLLVLLLLTLISRITSCLHRLKKRILPITQTIIVNICGKIICVLICGIVRNSQTLKGKCWDKQSGDPDHRDPKPREARKTTTTQSTVGPERQGDARKALTHSSDKEQRLRHIITILQFHKKHSWADQMRVMKLLFCLWWSTRSWKFWLRYHEPKHHREIRVNLCRRDQFGRYSKLRFQNSQWLRVYESVKSLLIRVVLLLFCLFVGGCCFGLFFNT